jgi:hypothetical protein
MRRWKQVLAFTVLAVLLAAACGPAAYADKRHVDVTVQIEPADFFDYVFVQGQPYSDLARVKRVVASVTVGGSTVKEVVLDKNNLSQRFDLDTKYSGNIKVVVVYDFDKKLDQTFELPYTKAGQTVVISYHSPVDEIKTLKLP